MTLQSLMLCYNHCLCSSVCCCINIIISHGLILRCVTCHRDIGTKTTWLVPYVNFFDVNKLYIDVTGSTQVSLPSGYYNRGGNSPSAKKMPPTQLISPLLHHLNFLKRLWVIGEKLWKLGIRQVPFLQTLFRRCLSGRFMSKFSRNRPFTSYDEAEHHSLGLFNNVDCFRKLPISFFGSRQKSQSFSLHDEERYYHPDPQTPPSTSRAVVPYSTTPMVRAVMNISTRNSTWSSTTRAEDDGNRDPPGLSKEISNFVGVTSAEFERYERNFTSYVLTTDY